MRRSLPAHRVVPVRYDLRPCPESSAGGHGDPSRRANHRERREIGMKVERRGGPVRIRAATAGRLAAGSAAVGTLAIGSLAIGSLAIGMLAVGRIVVGRAEIKYLRIAHLEVGELTVTRSQGLLAGGAAADAPPP